LRETVEWLTVTEDRSAHLFERLAESFRDDRALWGLLKKLSEDELTHRQIMANILSTVKDDVAPFVIIKDDAKYAVEDAFDLLEKAVREKSVTRENLFDHIIDIESSEFNSICLHVINTLKHCDRSFRSDAAKIHRHKAAIDRFVRTNPGFERYAERLDALPDVWRERILVVDDDAFVAEALKEAVVGEGTVDTAENGREALRMIGRRYYAAILSDVDMPVMGGIEMRDRAMEVFPSIEKRLLFFTESSNLISQSLLRARKLKFLVKPSGVNEIRLAVAGMLDGM